jgi:hypothetical protein
MNRAIFATQHLPTLRIQARINKSELDGIKVAHLVIAQHRRRTGAGKSMSDDFPDLAAVIIRFAESLPATIRWDILCFVLLYATAFSDIAADGAQLLPEVRAALSVADRIARFGATLRFIGGFDYVLWRAVRTAAHTRETNEQFAGAMPEYKEVFEEVLAAEPLRTKHFERAWADWRQLRDGPLSPDMLMDYENSLLRTPLPTRSDRGRGDQ